MAVQKSKKSRSKRDKKRYSKTLFKKPVLSIDKKNDEVHIRHFITINGYYRNKKVKKLRCKSKKKEHDK